MAASEPVPVQISRDQQKRGENKDANVRRPQPVAFFAEQNCAEKDDPVPINIAVIGGAISQANNCFVRVGKKYKMMNAKMTTLTSNGATNFVNGYIRSVG